MAAGRDTIPVKMFLDAVRKWIAAIDEGNEPSARFYADEIEKVGRMLSTSPAYRRIFQEHQGECVTPNPDDVLLCMHAYFHAATDAALLNFR